MIVDNRNDYIKYRFQRAIESFDEALILAENKRWNAVVNRLYYSSFYAVISLLLKNNIETNTHDGARTQFGLCFVKTGKIDKKYGKLFQSYLIIGKKETMVICMIMMNQQLVH
jgi:uncharacterized protein (UPF0332 family)